MTRIHMISFTGALFCALALATALGSEHFLHLIPCALCLVERWPYRVGIAVGVVGALLPPRLARALCWVLVATALVAAGEAFVHVGVEQHWWPSPFPECMAPDLRGMSAAERFAHMPLHPSKSCEDPDYLIPAIPITMPQANFVYALALAAFLTILLVKQDRQAKT